VAGVLTVTGEAAGFGAVFVLEFVMVKGFAVWFGFWLSWSARM